MMQKVWVLERWTYDDRDIIGMFFSKTLAEEARDLMEETLGTRYDIIDFDAYYELTAWLADPDIQYRMGNC